MISERYSKYIFNKGHEKVEGWVAPGALTAMRLLMLAQEKLNIQGDIAEVGVHHGRYFIAMALHARVSEKFVAVDVFEDQHLNLDKSGRGDRERFLANLEAYGPPDAIERTEVLQRDSTAMSPMDFSVSSDLPRFRVFSVDGGHMVHHVKNDLGLAEATLVPGGIAVVDDFFNLDWPGVSEGIFSYSADPESKLVTFAYGDNKIYLSDRDHAEIYFRLIQRERDRIARSKETVLAGRPVTHVAFRVPEVAFSESQTASSLVWDVQSALRNSSTAVKFGLGWTSPAQHGVWSEGLSAELTIGFPELRSITKAEISLTVYPFTRDEKQRQVRVKVQNEPTSEFVLKASTPSVLRVSAQCPPDEHGVRLQIEHEPIGSPKDLGLSDDPRLLGVMLSSISVSN